MIIEQMELISITALCILLLDTLTQGLAVTPREPMDELIQIRLLELTQGSSLVEGLVLAGTIVEGGPVFGRPRRILGGQSVHPGLKLLDFAFKIEQCPTFTFGYHCKNWVSPECAVTRHMMFRMKLCTCKVDVC